MNEFPQINFQDTFTQEQTEYIVYFWQQSCSYCQQVEPDMIDFTLNHDIPIYLVDMEIASNQDAWYDWESHHKEYDIMIGKEENGIDSLDHDVKLARFEEDKTVNWTFHKNRAGEIIAAHNTPYANTQPNDANELEITGTPTIIHIKNGKILNYAVGVDPIQRLLNGR